MKIFRFLKVDERTILRYGLIATVTLAVVSCSKNDTTNITKPKVLPANAITSTALTGGPVKGVMLEDSTYTVSGDITVLQTDSLVVQPGAKINVVNNSAFYVLGTIISQGTKDSPVVFTSPAAQPGSWGGFQCDSAKVITFKWTKILWTGGPDSSGDPRETITVDAPVNLDVEDCWILDGQDNAIGAHQAKVTILRNTIDGQGTTDGEALDFKNGVTGTIAYNVIWGTAGSAMKLETSGAIQIPQSNLMVYNNTLVDNGFRRGAAEPGRGILLDDFVSGQFFNNLIVNNYYGFDLDPSADITHITYGHNYFYTTVDSLVGNFYPPGSVGVSQSSDIISKTTGANDPMFANYSTSPNPSLRVDPNDFHLKSGSPAIGAGDPTYNKDIGAYTTDGQGNQH